MVDFGKFAQLAIGDLRILPQRDQTQCFDLLPGEFGRMAFVQRRGDGIEQTQGRLLRKLGRILAENQIDQC